MNKDFKKSANEMIVDMFNTDIAGNLGEPEADIKKGIDIFSDLTDEMNLMM